MTRWTFHDCRKQNTSEVLPNKSVIKIISEQLMNNSSRTSQAGRQEAQLGLALHCLKLTPAEQGSPANVVLQKSNGEGGISATRKPRPEVANL